MRGHGLAWLGFVLWEHVAGVQILLAPNFFLKRKVLKQLVIKEIPMINTQEGP